MSGFESCFQVGKRVFIVARRARRGRGGVMLAVLLAWMLLPGAGCSAQWRQQDDACVREMDGEHEQRVINYTDPELCERRVKERRREHVRVPAPEER